MKGFVKQIKAHLVLIKGYGTIRSYQRVIVISTWIMIGGIISSIIISFYTGYRWITILGDYSIGITCSAIVLLVSTSLQFVGERDRIAYDYIRALRKAFLYLSDVINNRDHYQGDDFSKAYTDLSALFEKCTQPSYTSLYWFDVDTYDSYQWAITGVYYYSIRFVGEYEKNPKERINDLTDEKLIEYARYISNLEKKYFSLKNMGILDFILQSQRIS